MSNLICKSCGFIQEGYAEDSKEKNHCRCKRCGSTNMNIKSREIKLYYECLACKKFFKIGEMTAMQLMFSHKTAECLYCKSEYTHTSYKNLYKKYSGQTKRIYDTKIITLFD